MNEKNNHNSDDKAEIKKERKLDRDMKITVTSKFRVYGIPYELIHDSRMGPIIEGRKDYPFIGIQYCGYKTPMNEIRQPTPRMWYFEKEAVEETGPIKDYIIDNITVHYYDIDLQTSIHEKYFNPVNIGDEISLKPKIIASKLIESPSTEAGVSGVEELEREELEKLVARQIEKRGSGVVPIMESIGGVCKNYCTKWTPKRHDPWTVIYNDGGHCD